jgi:nucleoside 2-deoxyribosyltransferase
MHQTNPESAIGFCAMWFADDLKPLWSEALEPAIRAAGYEPKRIDQHEHVNRIDDEIVAMIRRSRFVVADFTGQRGGVYFEAGYALGLGLRVIWLCRQDELDRVHFDTRQYNFLVWKPSEYADLAKRLQNRIEATLGRGPIQ